MSEDTRIPLSAFADFQRCRLEGTQAGMRWSAAMDAFEATRIRLAKENKESSKNAAAQDWRDVYIVR